MRILLIEDNKDLCELISDNLEGAGHRVEASHDGEEGYYLLAEGGYDVVLLDRMLPGMNGLDVLKKARAGGVQTPVVLITAMGDLQQVVDGLDAGADDYLVKPFAVPELMARVRAVGRRPAPLGQDETYAVGDLRLDAKELRLETPRAQAQLSPKEGELLGLLMKNAGKTLGRDVIFGYVWGMNADVDGANLDNYIHFVRSRLAEVQAACRVKTVRGVGYRLEEAGDEG